MYPSLLWKRMFVVYIVKWYKSAFDNVPKYEKFEITLGFRTYPNPRGLQFLTLLMFMNQK